MKGSKRRPPTHGYRLTDVPRLIRELRVFIGLERLKRAEEHLGEVDAANNPFRSVLVREKQPLIDAFREFDSITMHGARPITRNRFRKAIQELAYLAALYNNIKYTLPMSLAGNHISKLIDLHGKRLPVLTEWEAANFYLEEGFQVRWKELGNQVPEFVVTKDTLVGEFECKRFSRYGMEKLQDRDAAEIATAVLCAMRGRATFGEITIDVSQAEQISAAAILPAILPVVTSALDSEQGDIELPAQGLGHIRFKRNPNRRSVEDVDHACRNAPHDCRKYAVGESPDANGRSHASVLYLRGPRKATSDYMAHIEHVLQSAAVNQLTGTLPGFLVAEIDDVGVETYRDQGAFNSIAGRIFAQCPYVGGVVWRTSRAFEVDSNSVNSRIDGLAMRNDHCSFQKAISIPLVQRFEGHLT